MKYLCVNCNFIYDEALWDKWEWIESWTKIEYLSPCPVCLEYDTFNHINEEVIYIEENTKDLYEMSHFIEAEKKDWKILITIGHDVHPMWEEHRISWIWIYDEYWDLVTEEFLWIDFETSIEFEDYDLDEFEIRIKCTQHNLFARKFDL